MITELRVTSTEAQQHIGTELGRRLWHERVWLDHWLRWAEGRRVVQESVRFPDEAEAIHMRGGLSIEVRRLGVGPLSDHPSERLPADPDRVLMNDGTIADLKLAIDTLVASL